MIENSEYLKEAAQSSMDFSKIQIDEILKAHNTGQPIEFESFSPYIADHDLAHGDIRSGGLTNEEQIGLQISKTLREQLPEARMVSLYDEYNTNVPDSADPSGRPMSDGKQVGLPDDVKNNFKQGIIRVLRENNLSRDDDLLISESSKIKAAHTLEQRLREHGLVFERDGAVYFRNPNPENPAYAEVLLRSKNGRWMCEALDASTYLDPKNLDITHIVALSNHFKPQQDKVWEILRSLGIQNRNYHNIFYDETLPPEAVAEVIREKFIRAGQTFQAAA
ncbi:MAG: hypothetical protein WCV50_05565 [Patescibacteria group bacterium]|jgi:hypothetical protein